MSLDISLHKAKVDPVTDPLELGEEVMALNWLRNPYGLCNWAEDNFDALGIKADIRLHYVINNWNYDKSKDVDRKLFKSVVDGYWKALQKIDKAYFFFNVYSYMQFIEPDLEKFPKEYIEVVGRNTIKGMNHALPDKVGIPIQYFQHEAFNLGFEEGVDPLDKYKSWFYELVLFAERLQDESLEFYCSN